MMKIQRKVKKNLFIVDIVEVEGVSKDEKDMGVLFSVHIGAEEG